MSNSKRAIKNKQTKAERQEAIKGIAKELLGYILKLGGAVVILRVGIEYYACATTLALPTTFSPSHCIMASKIVINTLFTLLKDPVASAQLAISLVAIERGFVAVSRRFRGTKITIEEKKE